jgi:peptidoglycan/LPS O-acetylase OafA/YrhL
MVQSKDKNDLLFLNGLRGLASFYVMVGHARWLLWEGYSSFLQNSDNYGFFHKFQVYLISFFRFGHEMVLFFFILSGFVIHLSYARSLASGARSQSFDLIPYFKRRIKRIYPPFLFALLFGFLLDYFGKELGYSIYKNATPNILINNNIEIDFTLVNFFGNLFFLQNTYVPIWGSNGPLWSLKFEWWFYMIYPILFIINRRSAWLSNILIFLVSFLLISGYIDLNIKLINEVLGSLVCWWLGAFLADIYVKRIALSLIYFVPFVSFFFIIPFLNQSLSIYKDLLTSFGFFGLLAYSLYLNINKQKFIILRKLNWLGNCSYTLYVIHFPIIVFFNGYALSKSGNAMPINLYYFWFAILFCLGFSYFLHFFTEKSFLSGKSRSIN